jgi:hypothetical protein
MNRPPTRTHSSTNTLWTQQVKTGISNKLKPHRTTIWDERNPNETKTKHNGQELVNFDEFIYYLIDTWDIGSDLLEGSN